MKFRLFPQENRGLELLSQMAQQLVLGVNGLSEVLGGTVEEYGPLAEELHRHQARTLDLHYALMTHMRTSYINPLPREDLYDLARLISEAVENLDAAAEMLALYKLNRISPRAAEQLEVISRQAEMTADAMKRLGSFEELEEYWIQMLQLTNRAERTHRIWVTELLRDHKPAAYLRHRDVANYLADVAKSLRRVATHVGKILVKES